MKPRARNLLGMLNNLKQVTLEKSLDQTFKYVFFHANIFSFWRKNKDNNNLKGI